MVYMRQHHSPILRKARSNYYDHLYTGRAGSTLSKRMEGLGDSISRRLQRDLCAWIKLPGTLANTDCSF